MHAALFSLFISLQQAHWFIRSQRPYGGAGHARLNTQRRGAVVGADDPLCGQHYDWLSFIAVQALQRQLVKAQA